MSSNINGNTQISEMIVVAVPNTNRRRDLTPTHTLLDGEGKEQALFAATGGGDKFLQFFREELFPEVESRYRTIPHRTIVGNSLGGLLALHVMVQSPDLFQGYIANDPSLWWDDQYVLRQAKNAIAPDRQSVQSVFISSAANLNDRMSEMAQEMAEILEVHPDGSIRAILGLEVCLAHPFDSLCVHGTPQSVALHSNVESRSGSLGSSERLAGKPSRLRSTP